MKWIAKQEDLDAAVQVFATATEIAIDTEADSLHSYFDKVCLIQVSAGGEDYIIDPLAKMDLAGFGAVIGDANVRKILHGGDYDVRILQRDFGFRIRNLTDTMVSAQVLGYAAFGLAALLEKHFSVKLDKSNQLADWAMRPLRPDMLRYAALDTQYLSRLAAILKQELEALGRWDWAVEEFSRLEAIRYEPAEPDEDAFRKIKGSNKLERRALAALTRLHKWRDGIARSMDRPPFKVMMNEALIGIATALPRDREAFLAIRGVSPYHMSKHSRELTAIVEETVGLAEADLPARGEGRQWLRDKVLEKRVDALKKVRDRYAAELKIEPSVLAPRHVLTSVATTMPQSVEELAAVPAMREWQKRVMGDALIATLHQSS